LIYRATKSDKLFPHLSTILICCIKENDQHACQLV
jgi:hypothetical protein